MAAAWLMAAPYDGRGAAASAARAIRRRRRGRFGVVREDESGPGTGPSGVHVNPFEGLGRTTRPAWIRRGRAFSATREVAGVSGNEGEGTRGRALGGNHEVGERGRVPLVNGGGTECGASWSE